MSTKATNPWVQLEYIEATGTQYIDTGFKPNNNTKIVADMEVPAGSKSKQLFGARNAGASPYFYLGLNGSSYWLWAFAKNATTTTDSTSGRFTFENDGNTFKINGSSYSCPLASFSSNYPIFIFTMNNGGSPYGSTYMQGKLYSFKIYDNGTLARDFIPAQKNDGTVGLVDQLTGTFYGSKAGTLVPGAVVPVEPEKRKITVDLIPPMTGEKTADFNIEYSVTDDVETQTFTVKEQIDGTETQSRTVTASQTITTLIESTGLADGLHTFMLIVDDTVEVEYTFYVNNTTVVVNATGVNIAMPKVVNINEKFLVSVIVSEQQLTLAKLKVHAGDVYAGEV